MTTSNQNDGQTPPIPGEQILPPLNGQTPLTSNDQTPTPQPPLGPNHVPISQLSTPVPLSQKVDGITQATIIPPPVQEQTTAPVATPLASTPPLTPIDPATTDLNASGQAANDDTEEEENDKPLWRRMVGFLISWVIIPAGLVFIVHNFVFQAWYVDGQSMEPTFQNGNYLIVSKFDVSWKKLTGQSSKLDIHRGDVVIFNPPNFPTDIYFIKRAIGLPGERVLIQNGTVSIFNNAHPTGVMLNESYVGNVALEGYADVTVGEGEIFVLGDNRHPQASQDSRYFGAIPMNRMIGTAALRLLPIYEFGQLSAPQYSL